MSQRTATMLAFVKPAAGKRPQRTKTGRAALRLSDDAENLIRNGILPEEAYRRLGITRRARRHILRRLQNVTPEVRELVKQNKIESVGLLRAIAGIAQPEHQVAIARAFCEGRLDSGAIRKAMHSDAPEGLRRQILAIALGARVQQ